LDRLREGFATLRQFHTRLGGFFEQTAQELARWHTLVAPEAPADDEARLARERAAHQELTQQHGELFDDFRAQGRDIERAAEALAEARRTESWQSLQALGRREAAVLAELFVLQTQIRVYLIRLRPIELEPREATETAFVSRLDLMNERARVVDAWRKITVAADGLESNLDLVFAADIATEPGRDNPLGFSSAASSYRAGFRFDSPLNRKAERNIYRTQLINYQRARRTFMALRDRVEQAVRRDLRQIQADQLNFEIARQSLIIAARQVEQARDQLLLAPGGVRDSSTTQDVLIALNALLQAKNALIEIWVSYETTRLQLLLDLEALQLDERGVHNDERDDSLPRSS
jgi:hypothetical protein